MWKPTLALLAACAVAVPTVAPAAGGDPTPAPTTAPPPCTPLSKIYALGRWHDPHPGRGKRACEGNARRVKKRFFEYRIYRQAATFPSPLGSGPRSPADLRYFAVPYTIVCGESEPHWRGTAAFRLPDGAYQIIPSTWAAYGGQRFAATAGGATPLEQHVVAARAWRAGEDWYGRC